MQRGKCGDGADEIITEWWWLKEQKGFLPERMYNREPSRFEIWFVTSVQGQLEKREIVISIGTKRNLPITAKCYTQTSIRETPLERALSNTPINSFYAERVCYIRSVKRWTMVVSFRVFHHSFNHLTSTSFTFARVKNARYRNRT